MNARLQIADQLRKGKSWEAISNAFRVQLSVVERIAEQEGIANPNAIVHVDAQVDRQETMDDIPSDVVLNSVPMLDQAITQMRRQEIMAYTPSDVMKLITRAETEIHLKKDLSYIQATLRAVMLNTFPANKTEFSKDDYVKLKLLLEMNAQLRQAMLGDQALLPDVVVQAQKAVFAIPTQTFYGTGDEVLVDD